MDNNSVKEALQPYAEALAIAAVMDHMYPSITAAVEFSLSAMQPNQIIVFCKKHFRSDKALSDRSVPRAEWKELCTWDEYHGRSAYSALIGYLEHIRSQYPAAEALSLMQVVLRSMQAYYDWYATQNR